MTAGRLFDCRVQSGYRVDDALVQRFFQRTDGQVVLVVALEPQLGRVLDGHQHLGIAVPVVRVGELLDLDVGAGHAVHPEHQLDALLLRDAPPVALPGVQALGEADLPALQVAHPVDVVPGAHHHAAAFVDVRRPQQPGPADVGMNVDRWEQAADADQVVEVMDVVRVPVVRLDGAEVGVLHADLLELLPDPAECLVDIAGGHDGTIGVPDLFPIQGGRAQFLGFLAHD
jgi:hypothetical protein